MSEPVRTYHEVMEDLRLGRLVRCTPIQYPEVRAWLVDTLPTRADAGDHEIAVFIIAELKRLDYEMAYDGHPGASLRVGRALYDLRAAVACYLTCAFLVGMKRDEEECREHLRKTLDKADNTTRDVIGNSFPPR